MDTAAIETELAALATAPVTATAIARVRGLCAAEAAWSPRARCLAAAVMLASDELPVVQLAHDLAVRSMAGHGPARSLAARTFDRLRVLRGEPQKFGTQRRTDGSLWPIDPATTDSERAKWDLPPLRLLQTMRPEDAPR